MRTDPRKYWALLLPLLLCASCEEIKETFGGDEDEDFERRDLRFFNQWQGTESGVEQAAQKAIRNNQQWRDLWDQIHSGQADAPEVPNVNFEKRMVVAALMGRKPTGGYDIQITRVREREEDVRVRYREISPTGDGSGDETSPYHLVEVRKVRGKTVEWRAEGTAKKN